MIKHMNSNSTSMNNGNDSNMITGRRGTEGTNHQCDKRHNTDVRRQLRQAHGARKQSCQNNVTCVAAKLVKPTVARRRDKGT